MTRKARSAPAAFTADRHRRGASSAARRGPSGAGAARRGVGAAAGPRGVSLHVCPKGSGVVLAARIFADAVIETAGSAVETSRRLTRCFDEDLAKIHAIPRGGGSAGLVHAGFRQRPLWTIQRLTQETKLAIPTVIRALETLQRLEIVREITGRRRNRVFAYDHYIAALNEGTEPL